MIPQRERACDELLQNPLLRTPPPEPERPRPPRIRKPREFKLPPRFPLLSKDFYASWCNHQKELQLAKHKVDDHPPGLFPELYLKPRRLNYYARQLEENMNVNKELLKRINLIQRTGRSEQPLTKELEVLWKDTKHKLILGASLPFILFKTEKIDRDIKDSAFDKPPNINRPKVSMEIWVIGGSKIGRVTMELFTDLVPKTCQLFMSLVKGDSRGHAYMGTRIFRVVPDLYCRAGDVTKDNGFGCYLAEGQTEPPTPESFRLKHSVPGIIFIKSRNMSYVFSAAVGVLSMVVTSDNEVCGQFNIIFKPLPQFDGKHVVFGRIIGGPAQALERISALGLPLGSTTSDCIIRYCGWFTRTGQYREGNTNAIKFPPRRKT
ncbi:unnamed protein product [Pieris brassicae]|uniref:PPIase cyclophilin-type domain-containing protein n=1 Tax=Pieris brassicae TaxID=7116 RepID=A0A9P0XIT8_PIEBR|nr:unnamed protein product [Pieris brassicae]